MRVTIKLDSGGFLTDEASGLTYLDVGYFETPGAHDIEVYEDAKPRHQHPKIKLGHLNEMIVVEHLSADGIVKHGVHQSESFKRDILKKNELYPTNPPDFVASKYDCMLRFESGEFESWDVRTRKFKVHQLTDDAAATGVKTVNTRPIANDILVQFDVDKGEELRLRRGDGTDVWSTSSVGPGTGSVEVKILADPSLDGKYFKDALKHRGPHYHRPNPDPPPMNGNEAPPNG